MEIKMLQRISDQPRSIFVAVSSSTKMLCASAEHLLATYASRTRFCCPSSLTFILILAQNFVLSLALNGNHLVDSDVALLADALSHTGCALQSLLLSYNAIGVLGSTLLATALRENTRLRVLDLSHNRIGSDGVRPWLGSTLRINSTLQELRLSHNSFGDTKASELLDALAPKPESQEEAIKSQIARRRHTTAVAPTTSVFANAGRGKHVSAPEQPAEPFNSSMTVLQIGDTDIGDEAAQHLAHVLLKTHSLSHLDVSGNRFGPQGVLLLARALAKNSTLSTFEFSDNRVDDATAASAMLTATGTHPCLDKARFQGCFPTGDPTIAFAASSLVQSTRTIKTLDLVRFDARRGYLTLLRQFDKPCVQSHCLLEPPGAVALYRAIATNSSIRHLALVRLVSLQRSSLSHVYFPTHSEMQACTGLRSDAAAGVLAQALAANSTLEMLDVAHNALTMRGCKLLREASAQQARKVMVILEGNTGERKPVATGITVAVMGKNDDY